MANEDEYVDFNTFLFVAEVAAPRSRLLSPLNLQIEKKHEIKNGTIVRKCKCGNSFDLFIYQCNDCLLKKNIQAKEKFKLRRANSDKDLKSKYKAQQENVNPPMQKLRPTKSAESQSSSVSLSVTI